MTNNDLTRVALCVCLILSLQGCFSPVDKGFTATPLVQTDLKEIQKRGYLNALVDNNSVSYFIYRGQPMGYEYELLTRYCSYLKVELRIKVISGVEEAIDLLNKGEGDVIAFPLTITDERKSYVNFSNPFFKTTQVLVQHKPANYELYPDSLDDKMIRRLGDLVGKEVYVMKGSSFKQRLDNLSTEMGGRIHVVEDSADAETESLIRKVATGEIQYTVTDQTLALVNANYYPELDINTIVSLPQEIAWAVRLNDPELLTATNSWLKQLKRKGTFRILYDKYFNSPRTSLIRMNSDYSSLNGGKLSAYDEILKEGAKELGWDWRLLASIVYQESTFNPRVQSWAGAIGLMQLMPSTGEQFDINNLYDPKQNVKAGVQFLKYLDGLWAKTVSDTTERMKFVLASYNVGLSHVIDARNLTRKYGKDPTKWDDNVEFYLSQKSKRQFYRDPIAVAGYCRCEGPVNYVKEVLGRFEEYKHHIDD